MAVAPPTFPPLPATTYPGYVRWRSRMVGKSLFDDINIVLTACGWSNTNPPPLMRKQLKVMDFWPEDAPFSGQTPTPNLLALDEGIMQPLEEAEMGGTLLQRYLFSIALYGESDALCRSILQDLYDKYNMLTYGSYFPLYDYNQQVPKVGGPLPVGYLESITFNYHKADSPPTVPSYYVATLALGDYVPQGSALNMPQV